MPETVLVSKPAELVEAGEFNALTERVEKIESTLSKHEHAMFGFQRAQDNIWVDGVLQNVADIRRQQAVFVTYFIRAGLPCIAIGAISVFSNAMHNYGVDAALGAFFHHFLGF